MPLVRVWKISLPATRSSNWSQESRTSCITERVSDTQPHGRSSFRPPMRLKFGWNAAAGGALDQVEHVLAVAEAVERRRERADLQAHLAEEQHERGDARELGEDRADVLRARRRLDVHQLLGRVDERHLVGEARQPVDAVDQRGDLRVGAELGELLVAAVHVADHRVGREHALAVEAHHEAQRAVGGGVLRPEVEDHVAGVELDVDLRVGEVAQRVALESKSGVLVGTSVGVRR